MYNWSTDKTTLKRYPKQYKIWRLEQLINFGLGKEKLPLEDVKKSLDTLSIDTKKKNYLKFLVN